MITLEKIDTVVERTGVSFEAARDALNLCDGDEIEAIIYIQSKQEDAESKGVKAGDVIATLKEYIRRGNVSRIIIENEDDVILNIPLTFGAIGMVLAPVVAIIGLGATMLNKITVKIVDYEGKITNINKATAETFSGIKKAGGDMKDKMRAKKQEKEETSEDEEEVFEDGSEVEVDFEKDEDMCEWREDQGYKCDENKDENPKK
ncbi:MAG: DUF4342 domain-containing protein [Proteocatella sp.]